MLGVIVEILGPLSYQVKLNDRQIIKRHADYLLHHTGDNDNDESCQTHIDEIPSGPVPQEGSLQETSSTVYQRIENHQLVMQTLQMRMLLRVTLPHHRQSSVTIPSVRTVENLPDILLVKGEGV